LDQRRDNIFAPTGTAPTTWSRDAIEALPQGTNTTVEKVLLQFPGVTQDSSAGGNLHIRNEHANISYRINGILLPDGIGGLGTFLDPTFVGSLTLITGALPAQYGLRTAGIIDIQTPAFDNSGSVSIYGGSRQTTNTNIQYGGKTGNTEYFFTGRWFRTILGLENPTPSLNALHDLSRQERGFGYVSTVIDPTLRLTVMGGSSISKFQIPNVPNQLPSFTAFGQQMFDSSMINENQIERYKFGVVALQKSVADADLQLSYFTRSTSVHFIPDVVGDLMFDGVASDVLRTSTAHGVQGDAAFRLNDAHTLRTGMFVSAEKSLVRTTYQLLPFDGSDPTLPQILPDVPFPRKDESALLGWLAGVYISDDWRLTERLSVNFGGRFDQMWQYQNANQFSPRASLTYRASESTTLHAGYARTFLPPVQVIAAPSNTNLFTSCPPNLVANPNCTTVLAPGVPPPYRPFLPERAHVWDIGVVQRLVPGLELGVDAYYKRATDLIDDGQFGAAYVLNGFNYEKAENVGVELKALYREGNFRAYANLAWARQLATNVNTNQYLFDPDEFHYIRTNWIYTDHAQQWTGSAGISYLWYGTTFTADMIYGSGLRSGFANTDHNAPYTQVNAGIAHEFKFDGWWSPFTLRFDVVNVFDTVYALRNGTGIGLFAPQYGPRRVYYFGFSQKFGPGSVGGKAIEKAPGSAPSSYRNAVIQRATKQDPFLAVWTWTGFYLGANVGYSASHFSTDAFISQISPGTATFSTSFGTNIKGAVGGGQVGYNWQSGIWVTGIEADFDFTHQRTKSTFNCPAAICNPLAMPGFDASVPFGHEHNLDWFGTLRGRVGVAVTPDVLGFVTGGLVYGEVEQRGASFGFVTGADSSGVTFAQAADTDYISRKLKVGWTIGGGIEARLAGNWTGRVEYLHLNLGTDSALGMNLLNQTPLAFTFNSRITQDLVRFGLNYKFDPMVFVASPPAAIVRPVTVYKPRMVYKAPIQALWTWTGLYVGVNAGYSMGRSDTEVLFTDPDGTPLLATGSSLKLRAIMAGAQTGYNWQLGNWVTGLETDIQFTRHGANSTYVCPVAVCNTGILALTRVDVPVIVERSHNLDWFATVRGRLGISVTPDLLAFMSGGMAAGGITQSGRIVGSAPVFDPNGNLSVVDATRPYLARTTKLGWSIGGGVEAHIAGNLTGKIEYLYLNFGDALMREDNITNGTPIAVGVTSHITESVVRAGINYKFDPNAPAPTVVAASAEETVPSTKISRRGKGQMIYKGPIAPLWTWTGFYLGVNYGYSWGKADGDLFFNDEFGNFLFASTSTSKVNAAIGGAQTGFNWSFGSWLIGIEVDLGLSRQRGEPLYACPQPICNPNGPVFARFDESTKLEWFGTLRARLGATLTPDALIYMTAGAAIGEFAPEGTIWSFDANPFPVNQNFGNRLLKPGWTVGGGIETRIAGNWTGKIEYLYLDFGNVIAFGLNMNNQWLGIDFLAVPGIAATYEAHVTDKMLRVGINYKFD
jgi:opacity protein-like surface antigen/outer membrane receptor protein involved in Fe transport